MSREDEAQIVALADAIQQALGRTLPLVVRYGAAQAAHGVIRAWIDWTPDERTPNG